MQEIAKIDYKCLINSCTFNTIQHETEHNFGYTYKNLHQNLYKKSFYATITHFLYHITEKLEYKLHEPHICKEITQVF
jgi:NH3-dependent NAD+ synthetase